MFQAPTHLTNVRRLFDCVSSTFYRFPLCHTVFKADGRVHTYYLIANGSNSCPGSTYHRESKMAEAQSTTPTDSVADISDVDAEKKKKQ